MRTISIRAIMAIAAFVLVVSPIPSASAARNRSLMLLKLQSEVISDDLIQQFDEAVRLEAKKLRRTKLLPTPKLDFAAMQLTAGCAGEGPACLAAIGQMLEAGRVLRTELTGSSSKLQVKVTIVSANRPKRKVRPYLCVNTIKSGSLVNIAARSRLPKSNSTSPKRRAMSRRPERCASPSRRIASAWSP